MPPHPSLIGPQFAPCISHVVAVGHEALVPALPVGPPLLPIGSLPAWPKSLPPPTPKPVPFPALPVAAPPALPGGVSFPLPVHDAATATKESTVEKPRSKTLRISLRYVDEMRSRNPDCEVAHCLLRSGSPQCAYVRVRIGRRRRCVRVVSRRVRIGASPIRAKARGRQLFGYGHEPSVLVVARLQEHHGESVGIEHGERLLSDRPEPDLPSRAPRAWSLRASLHLCLRR
jgi:hypothetical protein